MLIKELHPFYHHHEEPHGLEHEKVHLKNDKEEYACYIDDFLFFQYFQQTIRESPVHYDHFSGYILIPATNIHLGNLLPHFYLRGPPGIE
jgi:hypothetical protein